MRNSLFRTEISDSFGRVIFAMEVVAGFFIGDDLFWTAVSIGHLTIFRQVNSTQFRNKQLSNKRRDLFPRGVKREACNRNAMRYLLDPC